METGDRDPAVAATAKAPVPRSERLDRAVVRASDAPLREGNRLVLLKDGANTYDDWLAQISRAERWVHLENYIIRADEVGHRFAEALCKKAAEGVRVRVLYDWFGCLDTPRAFWRQLRSAGVEVRAVNSPMLGAPLGVVRRDHRKLLAVDGTYGSTGGVCISEGWLVTSPETGLPYRDTAVSVWGPAVADLGQAVARRRASASGRHRGSGGRGGARHHPGAAQDAYLADATAAHRRRRAAVVDHGCLFPLHADPHAVVDGGSQGRRGRAGAGASHQRPALDRGALADRLPAVSGGGGAHLRVRWPDDTRQDARCRRPVVEGGLDEPELQQPVRQLGDRSHGR